MWKPECSVLQHGLKSEDRVHKKLQELIKVHIWTTGGPKYFFWQQSVDANILESMLNVCDITPFNLENK